MFPTARITTNPNPFLVNVPELQNVQTSVAGLDTLTALSSRVDQIGQMVNFTNKQIAVNTIKTYDSGNVTFLNDVIFNSNATTSGGTSLSTGASVPTGPSGSAYGGTLIWNTSSYVLQTSNLGFGLGAGQNNQGENAIAIGVGAGSSSQGIHAIAIGALAGVNSQSANSIVLNASGTQLDAVASGLYINPIRQITANSILQYDSGSSEISYNSSISLQSIAIQQPAPTYALELGVDSAAKPTSATWTTISDARVKYDIQPTNLNVCYSTIRETPLRDFAWSRGGEKTRGFIAQEVESLFPASVRSEAKNGFPDFRTLDVDQIYKTHLGATQWLIQKVEAHESTIQGLHTLIAAKS